MRATQLAEAERLDDVVVRAELEADTRSTSSPLAVTTMIGTSERARSRRQTSVPSMSGQPQVEQHEVGRRRLQRLLAGRDPRHLEALATQPVGERLGDRVVVFDDQDPHARIVARPPAAGVRQERSVTRAW